MVWAGETAPLSGSLKLDLPLQALSAWAPSGEYRLTGVDINDYIGNSTSYTATQIQSIFKNSVFRVENEHADNAFPAVLKGTIKTPSVSLSSQHAVFQADLTVYDAVSGIGYVVVILTSADGNYTNFGSGWTPAPIRGMPGKVTLASSFTGESYLAAGIGSWTISEVQVHNYAGTVLDIKDPAKIQSIFGTTTFQLTP